jgi:hypothetical protein
MKVFISYSQKDEALASKVVAILEEAGLDAWYDKREITPGENWAEKIAQGLRESDAMVVLLTPGALESGPVRLDIDYALMEKSYNKRLIPVIVGEPEEFSKEGIPWIFKHLNVINLPERGKDDESLRQIARALKEVA